MIRLQPYKLINTIQHYEWGTKGKNAFIPNLLNIKPEKDKPYAELWMGAHPKSPSKIMITGNEFSLNEIIRQYPEQMLGSKTVKKFSNTLPFLFKVLSANEALSIQVHPSKKQAWLLHENDPINYPDSNQKIEIAIALDSLTALVGFKPFNQIIKTFEEYPEIHDFVGKTGSSVSHKKKYFKLFFTDLIKKSVSQGEEFKSVIQILHKRIAKKKNKSDVEKFFLDLANKYKDDTGLLILFFLNLVHLKSGEAIFTKPGVPHAYLNGNILECMSNSDNVIRAGLTPKYKDIITLLNVLTFELGSPKILRGKKSKTDVSFRTEAKEFVVQLFNLGKKSIDFNDQSGPRIILVLDGEIKFIVEDHGKIIQYKYSKGDSVFLPSILKNFQITSISKTHFVIVSVPI